MRGFIAWMKSLRGSSRSQPCADARERRRRAYAKLHKARDRGDDRDYGRALMELRQATHDLLFGEVRG